MSPSHAPSLLKNQCSFCLFLSIRFWFSTNPQNFSNKSISSSCGSRVLLILLVLCYKANLPHSALHSAPHHCHCVAKQDVQSPPPPGTAVSRISKLLSISFLRCWLLCSATTLGQEHLPSNRMNRRQLKVTVRFCKVHAIGVVNKIH